MQPRRLVLLDDEAVALALQLAALGLLGLRKVALAIIGLDVQRGSAGHGLRPLASLGRSLLFGRRLARGGLLRRRLASASAVLVRRPAALLVIAEATFESGHQVDHVRALERRRIRIR